LPWRQILHVVKTVPYLSGLSFLNIASLIFSWDLYKMEWLKCVGTQKKVFLNICSWKRPQSVSKLLDKCVPGKLKQNLRSNIVEKMNNKYIYQILKPNYLVNGWETTSLSIGIGLVLFVKTSQIVKIRRQNQTHPQA
jgi:hypothetical protein